MGRGGGKETGLLEHIQFGPILFRCNRVSPLVCRTGCVFSDRGSRVVDQTQANFALTVGTQVSPQMMSTDDYLPMVACGTEKSK